MKKASFIKTSIACAMLALGLPTMAAVNYVADPDPHSAVTELSKVTLTFPDASEVDFGSRHGNVTVTGADMSRGCKLEYGEEANQMVISFSKIDIDGEYSVNVPEDAITADSAPVEAFTITYTIGKKEDDNIMLSPAPGEVDWLYSLVYEIPNFNRNINVESSSEKKPIVSSPSGEEIALIPVYDYALGSGKYRFNLKHLAVEPGEYTVKFPENYVYYYDDNYSSVYFPSCEFKYIVKGCELTKVESNPSEEKPTHKFNTLTLTFPGYESIEIAQLDYALKNVSIFMEGMENPASQVPVEDGTYGFQISGNSMTYSSSYSEVTTPGHYYMTFPQGCVLLGEEKTPCTPFMVKFDITAPEAVAMELNPAPGSTTHMLDGAIITFPEIDKVDLGISPNASLQQMVVKDGEEKVISLGGAFSSNSFQRISDNSFRMKFNCLATEDGDYRISIKANSFVFDGSYNQEYSAVVKFEAPDAPEFTLTPDGAEVLAKIQKFIITFPKESHVVVNEALQNKTVTLYKGEEITRNEYDMIDNPVISTTSTFTPVEGTTNSFSFSLGSAALDKGKYVLRIPAGIFLIGETPVNFNRIIEIVYECNGEGIDKIEAKPAGAVVSLQNMEVIYVDQSSISLQSEYTGFSLYKESTVNDWDDYLEYISGDNVYTDGNVLHVNATKEYTEEGRYYIDITAYSLFMSDGTTPSTPQRVYFTVDPNVSGVESMDCEGEDNRIFTITGTVVNNMDAPGIYIKAGKKYIVK